MFRQLIIQTVLTGFHYKIWRY